MGSVTRHSIATVLAVVLTLIAHAYMVYLRVPAVTTVRPKLTDVGFVTGLFSGRPDVYLWYHYPTELTILTLVVLLLLSNLYVFFMGDW